MYFNIERSIQDYNTTITPIVNTPPVVIYNNIKKNINTYKECKYAFKRWRKYSKQFRDTKYATNNLRETYKSQRRVLDVIYSHINTHALEYMMMLGLTFIIYLKHQERKYICY